MCLAVPLKVKSIEGTRAVLEADGVIVRADVSLVSGVRVGDYLLVHAGFAIAKVEPAEAEETISLWREISAGGR